jgi:hypothetical protein
MWQEKQQEIMKRYPEFFTDKRYGDKDDICFSFECNTGWYSMLEEMFAELKAIDAKLTFMQIKEKFGSLRVYYSHFGSEKMTDEEYKVQDKLVQDIITKYENKSYNVCEQCGAPGEVKGVYGWYTCACPSCLDERLSRKDPVESTGIAILDRLLDSSSDNGLQDGED